MDDRRVGLAALARARPDAVALVHGDERITFGALHERAGRAAGVLAAHGAGPQAPVACSLRNRPAFLEVLFGAAMLQAELVPVPWRARSEEVAYHVADSGAAVLIAEDDGPVITSSVLRASTTWAAALGGARAPVDPVDPAVPLLRLYTSGTTGRPKAVVRPRPDPAAYLTTVARALERFGVDAEDDVHLVCGPLYHAAPLAYATYALLFGQRVVLPERFDAAQILRLIEQERVTWSMMVPIHFSRILALPGAERARRDLSSIRRIIHAAAPCPPDLKRAMIALFPGAVWEFYGMTEGRATMITDAEWITRPGSVGRPFPGVRISIHAPDGAELPPGEVGLVYVSDDSRFAYAGAPDKTAEAWLGDRFTVGDMGYLDPDGYLFLTDRAADVIVTGGSNVYPAEVEAVLHRHPAVVDCAVIGVPDDQWGERVLALVELDAPPAGGREGARAAELIAFCREHLADYKCPREVTFVERLPRDEAGKVRRRELRAPYWEGRERAI